MLSIYLLVLNFQLASKIFFWVRARAKTSLKKWSTLARVRAAPEQKEKTWSILHELV